jgi:predicted aspartyl protease
MRGYVRSFALSATLFGTIVFASSAESAECKPLGRIASLDIKMLPSGRPAIDVLVGGQPQTFLIDTGGVISMVTPRTVRQLNLPVTRARDRVLLESVNGAATDQMAKLPSITIGNLHQEGPFFYVLPGKDDPSDPQMPEFAGILAPEFLQHFDVDFDFAHNKMNLFAPDHCVGQVVYWQAPKVAIVPISIDQGGHITFRMDLDGKRVTVTMDTGASTSTLDLNVARQAFNIDVNSPDVEKVGELKGRYTANIYQRRFKTLAVDGVVVNEPMITLLPNMTTKPSEARPVGSLVRDDPQTTSMLLGMTTLGKLHVYIAYKERKVYITAADTTPTAPAQQP